MASQVSGLSALIKPGLIPGFKVSKGKSDVCFNIKPMATLIDCSLAMLINICRHVQFNAMNPNIIFILDFK